ncbi:MAG: M3 family oligoendopeptidase, partial [Candidatus Hinthialibacter sp.]
MNRDKVREFPRTFVPEDADLGVWDALAPLFENLMNRDLNSKESLEKWLLDQSELSACLSEERARRYIAMTCHTNDEALEKSYIDFIEQIEPRCKPYYHQLNEKYLACPHRNALDRTRYEVLDRGIQADLDLYREENIALQTETAKLS